MTLKMHKIACLLLVLIAVVGLQSCSASSGGTVNTHNHSGHGGDFKLIDFDNRPFELSQLRGKVVLIFFGYTSCADACPTMLSKLKRVYTELGDGQKDVQTVFISVDPDRDTPAALKDFLGFFSIHAIGLTGKKEDIDKVVHQYGASYELEQSDSAAGYHINHSTYLYLIDQTGALRNQFKHTDSVDAIAAGIKQLLK
ncbi:MAG TPA: SCO family protein [Blastocatellia bacterium]|nr:SCO family protein [Blastocatellia bacterium]